MGKLNLHEVVNVYFSLLHCGLQTTQVSDFVAGTKLAEAMF